MRYISLFSGIEAASVAFHPLGWTPLAFAEIDPVPSSVLAVRFPDVPNHGDVTKFDWTQYAGQADVVIGGSPCQAFSVAGLRKSLADPRGNLTLAFVKAVYEINPAFVIWENVPGVLSAKDNAFGCFVSALVGAPSVLDVPRKSKPVEVAGVQAVFDFDAGVTAPAFDRGKPPRRRGKEYAKWPNAGLVDGPRGRLAWRVLDAQYQNLAQRRERVFVVFCPGDGADPAQILFERVSVPGNPRPSRVPRSAVAALTADGVGTCGADDNQAQAGHLIAAEFAPPLTSNPYGDNTARSGLLVGDVSPTLLAGGKSNNPADECLIVSNADGTEADVPTLTASGLAKHANNQMPLIVSSEVDVLVFDELQITSARNGSNPKPGDPCHTLPAVATAPVLAFNAREQMASSPDVFGALGAEQPQAQAVLYDDLAHTLTGEGFDASEDGPGRGTPLIAVPFDITQVTSDLNYSNPKPGDPSHPLQPNGRPPLLTFAPGDPLLAFNMRGREGGNMPEVTPNASLRAASGGSTGTFVAFQSAQSGVRIGEAHATLDANMGSRRQNGVIDGVIDGDQTTSVRRITPREAERLQGFPDNWTAILTNKRRRVLKDEAEYMTGHGLPVEHSKKGGYHTQIIADGPRYRMLGNSMAVDVIYWIGERIHVLWGVESK